MTSVVLHHHLGLGDHFVCNGLVNHVAEEHDVVYLPCKRPYYLTVACLYSEQPKVEVFAVDDEFPDVAQFADRRNSTVVRVGFEQCDRDRFDLSFYRQLDIPFAYRYSKFKLPDRIPQEDQVYTTLAERGDYCLVHRETSAGTFRLSIDTDLPIVEINKRRMEPPYNNLLNYRRLIQRAREIHCLNSSVVHLVDSLDSDAALVYHDIRKRNFQLRRSWTTVAYRAKPLREIAARTRRLFER